MPDLPGGRWWDFRTWSMRRSEVPWIVCYVDSMCTKWLGALESQDLEPHQQLFKHEFRTLKITSLHLILPGWLAISSRPGNIGWGEWSNTADGPKLSTLEVFKSDDAWHNSITKQAVLVQKHSRDVTTYCDLSQVKNHGRKWELSDAWLVNWFAMIYTQYGTGDGECRMKNRSSTCKQLQTSM